MSGRCIECYGIGRHAAGCPEIDDELERKERDPDDYEREPTVAERNVDAGDHLDRVAKAKGHL